MLRTKFEGREMILRIKTNLHLYSLDEDTIYSSLRKSLDEIYFMDTFALQVGEYLIIGETQDSAYPLITVQNIVPRKNIVTV
ncbi:MAG: hypothetical protein U9Q88_03725 [Bacillota bacterium]|jgi:hypothetical protein|uniref:hypothetical protein n=1 Tax=Bacillus sp. RO2 TaxID=2723913 RepID=UPI00145DE10F|nr:hypothetical protein [Bacillus sp. RO2]MEA3319114.1 hypothetical protein [Bacillota bacterium]NMH72235.1 hypothetical protein [Bacillus sp. RO2]